MLLFSSPLTPAATELFIYCLEISADMTRADTIGDEWTTAYPLSAKCFTRRRACKTLLDLLEKMRLSQTYVPTTYHWLLMYECLHMQIECLNDDPWPDFIEALITSQDPQDKAYVNCPLGLQRRKAFWIDFESLIDIYFWDTDFLLDPSTYYELGAPTHQQLGYRPDLFGVLSGLLPHPEELELKTIEELEKAE